MTAADLETGAVDSAASFIRPKKKPFTHQGEPCKNCGTPLEGWYCYSCGQNADTHHRSILHLIWEAIEGMFHLDGRLANTLPLLFFKPGVLAKDYMEGRIVRHVPPFRTFLVALLLFIFAAEHAIHSVKHHTEEAVHKRAEALATPQGRAAEADRMRAEAVKDRDARLKEAAEDRDSTLAEAAKDRDEALKDSDQDKAKVQKDYQDAVAQAPVEYQADVAKAQKRYDKAVADAEHLRTNPLAAQEVLEADKKMRKAAADQIRAAKVTSFDSSRVEAEADRIAENATETATVGGVHIMTPNIAEPKADADAHGAAGTEAAHGQEHWLKAGLVKALENPEYYMVVMFGWGHRLAVLLLPMLGLSLTLVYLNKRQFFVYDHMLVATNLLSFAFLTNALGLVLPDPVRGWWFFLLMVWTPINLFQTLRGGYGSSIPGAIIKTLIVWWSTMFSFVLLMGVLMIFALAQI
ncbi:3'-5' exonuclease [Caulobacter sp. Root1455]|uniref:DUF3667 domain-containing protein n=1 Tax=Caulobacter sp. Root1455 TaxID=1736465 RepID=UPI0006FAB53B|nr:DUF3667 domain-containing protein [Caulobacter sp. Root1455]KQY92443.1 3'-5' exonuclease [Caulobacter sp. Root1455]